MTPSFRWPRGEIIALVLSAGLIAAAIAGCPKFESKHFGDDDSMVDDDASPADDDAADDDAADDDAADDDASDDDSADDDAAECDYFNDFETNAAGWSHSGTADDWQLGEPHYANGPAACHSGTHCWGTNLAGPYNTNENASVVSPRFMLRGDCQLNFWAWWNIAAGAKVYVEISGNGSSWDAKATYVTGNSGWTHVFIDLTGYDGEFYLRWRFQSGVLLTAPGFYFDDVAIAPSL